MFKDTIVVCMGNDGQNGPKQRVGRIVWAKVCGFFFLCVFYILTNHFSLFRFNLCLTKMRTVESGSDNKNGPNKATCLIWCQVFFLVFYYNMYVIKK